MHRGSYWCSCHRNAKQNSESFFNYGANLTSVINMELSLRCWFLYMTLLAVTPSMLKTSVKFEVHLLNSGYAPVFSYSFFHSFFGLLITHSIVAI